MDMARPAAQPRRETDTDIMRIIAAFFVVLLHAAGTDSVSAVILNSVSRFSVPAFVIISGYYMLSRRHSGGQLAKKCGRLFALLLAWSGIYYLYGLLCGQYIFSGVRSLLRYLLTEPVHLWYLYAAIGLYLFTPLFYVFCAHASRREYLYALSLCFGLGSVAVILLRAGAAPLLSVILDKMKIAYTLGFAFLYLLGGYLQRYAVEPGRRGVLYLLGLLGLGVTAGGTLLLRQRGAESELLLSFFAPNVLAAGAAFFLLVRQCCLARPLRSGGLRAGIRGLADCTTGIYLLHPLCLSLLQGGGVGAGSAPCLGIPLRTILAFALSAAVIFVLKKIPILKWLA